MLACMATDRKARRVKKALPAAASGAKEVAAELVAELRSLGKASIRTDMADRYGIRLPDPEMAFGVRVSVLQEMAKRIRGQRGRDHGLAQALWQSGYYEARMLASFIDDPKAVTAAQMNSWVKDFDNWGICDTVCFHLFDRIGADQAMASVEKWSVKRAEFTRRAAFALLASLALHDKKAADEHFERGLELIELAGDDERNFVKKSVSWALRGIGKRGGALKQSAIEVAERLAASDDRARRWIGKDALRDLKRPGKPRRAAKK